MKIEKLSKHNYKDFLRLLHNEVLELLTLTT